MHKKLRSKRFAPILIQEVTRRTHLRGIFQAIYTAGVFLPTPVSRCQYYHRNLNPPKLVKLGFSGVPRNSTVARMSTYYRVPTETNLPGLRELEKRDLKQASRLLRAYMARFDMAPLLSNKDIEHALWTGRGKDVNGKRENQVTWAYVVEVRPQFPTPRSARRRRTDSAPLSYPAIGPGHPPDYRRLLILRPAFHRTQIATAHQRQRRVLVLLRHDRRSFVCRSRRRQCRGPGQELEGRDGQRTCGTRREAQALDGRRAGRGRQGEWPRLLCLECGC